MLGFSFASAALAAGLALLAQPVAAADVDPIVIKGNHFFYRTNGTQFYIKGVAYQQDFGGNGTTTQSSTSNGFNDPLADTASCDRDIPLMRQLGINAIRVYAIDPSQNHDHCMNALSDAGIYVISDLSAPNESIDRYQPTWTVDLLQRYTGVIDALHGYSNVIGFFAGNEVANAPGNSTAALAFVKAAVRDSKAYIVQKNYRTMYVGYASSDNDGIRTQIEDYLNCSPDTKQNIDFFGYNIYSWCGESNYQESQYEARTNELQGYSVPAFFAEYGCNQNPGGAAGRLFTEVGTLYCSQMTPVWSGGMVYEWFQEDNDYGLVSVSGSSASTLDDFNALRSELASATPTILNSGSYNPTNTAVRACPTEDSMFQVNSTALPPAPNVSLCGCMVQSLSCAARGTVPATDAGDLFNFICGGSNGQPGVDCSGISSNGTTGAYGAYSMCDLQSRLSWAFNAYYKAHQSQGATACDFNGVAATKNPSADAACSSQVSAAGGVQGSVAQTGSLDAGAGGAASATSSGAAVGVTIPAFDTGFVKLGFSVLAAFATGFGIVLL